MLYEVKVKNYAYFKLVKNWAFSENNFKQNIQRYEQHRHYSRKGFFENLVDNIKQEFSKDPELKKNIERFRQDSKELEDSEALQKAREKFKELEKEATGSRKVVEDALGNIKSKVSSVSCCLL